MAKKKILVIGGAGFLGYHISKKLMKKFNIHIVDNLSRGKLDKILKLIKTKCQVYKKDLSKNIPEFF